MQNIFGWMARSLLRNCEAKTRILELNNNGKTGIHDFPEWSYDGSSTYQAPGDKSDLVLRPCNFVSDPIRGAGNYLVMCEVFHVDGKPVPSNTRAPLRLMLESSTRDLAFGWVMSKNIPSFKIIAL